MLMQRTCISYAQFFNRHHGHVGKVFQNRFSATPITTDEHLIDAIRYIHFNARDLGLSHPREYQWSSYRGLSGESIPWGGKGLCEREFTLSLFGLRESFIHSHETARETIGMKWVIYKPRMNDDDTSIAERLYGKNLSDKLISMKKDRRNNELQKLKKFRLSIWQIERLTGIGRGIIAKA